MQDGSTIIASKLANALIPNARPTIMANTLSTNVLGVFNKLYGGLWVGGTITLTPHKLGFMPNSMNRRLHENVAEIAIPLERVVDVTDRFGVLTRIVDVKLDDGTKFTFRCFGSVPLVRQISDAANACRAA